MSELTEHNTELFGKGNERAAHMPEQKKNRTVAGKKENKKKKKQHQATLIQPISFVFHVVRIVYTHIHFVLNGAPRKRGREKQRLALFRSVITSNWLLLLLFFPIRPSFFCCAICSNIRWQSHELLAVEWFPFRAFSHSLSLSLSVYA